MAYIGRQLARGENKLFDDISSSFNGSTTVFNLTVSSVATSTATPYQLFVSLGGVMQKPNTDFTTAGNQITFTTAPAAGLSCWIMMQGDTIDQAAIPDASVTPSKISGSNFAFSGDLRLKDADGSHYVGFASPSTVAANKVWTLPAADGTSGQFLKTNGSAVLSWDTVDTSTLMPLSGGIFSGDVTFDGATAGYDIVWDKSDNALEWADNAKAKFGTGGDLEIFHNASNSVINDAGTGDLLLQVGGSTKATVSSTGFGVTGALTVSTNATITGNLTVSGTTTTVDSVTLSVKDKNIEMGVVSSPSDTTADGGGITLKGATDKTFNWVDSTDAWTSSEHIHLLDNKKLLVGTGSDLEIFHDGNNSHIRDTGTGSLFVKASTFYVNSPSAEDMITATADGAVTLYHDNSARLATSATGCTVTGTLAATAVTGDGSGLTNLPPAGNTVDLVADGAIAAGKPCIIKTNGKAEQVTTVASRGTPTAMSGTHVIGGSATNWGVVRADPATGHGVLIYLDADSGDYVRAQGFRTNASTGALTLSGSALDLQNDGTGGSANSLTHLTGNKFLAVYRRGSNSDLAYKVITYNSSHGTVTAGSQTTASQNGMLYTQQQICAVSGSKAVVVYRDQGDSNKGKACVLSISGTSVSVGSPVTFWTSATNYHSVCYDSNADRIVVQWNAGSSNIAIVGTVSGTSITFGSAVTVGTASAFTSMCFESTNNKMILAWNEGSTAMKLRVATVATSGNSLTFDAAASNWYNAQPGKIELAFVPSVGSICIIFSQSGNSNRLVMYTGYLNTSNGTAQYEFQIVIQSSVNGYAALTQTTSGYVVAGSQQNTGNYNTRIRSLKAFVDATNATARNVIGFANSAINDTATGTINIQGSIATGLSGLTPATIYYVQDDGTLGTSVQSTQASVLALASDKGMIQTRVR
jgi:hypothetical protein